MNVLIVIISPIALIFNPAIDVLLVTIESLLYDVMIVYDAQISQTNHTAF
jgi:hypothetical protein